MRQSGEYRIRAPADAVWLALNDPEVLSQCIEGCQSMTRTGDDAFAATVKAKIGPLSAVFTADVKLADLDPPNAYTLEASVKGGAAGFGKGSARVSLTEDGGDTLLRYDVEGSVGGKLAQVGQRLIDVGARKMADDFFARFSEIVAPTRAATAEAAAPQTSGSLAPILFVIAAITALFVVLHMRRAASRIRTERPR